MISLRIIHYYPSVILCLFLLSLNVIQSKCACRKRLSKEPYQLPKDCGRNSFVPSRLRSVAGLDTKLGDFPSYVKLEIHNNYNYSKSDLVQQYSDYSCAGVIIADDLVLTAGHCVRDIGESYKIYVIHGLTIDKFLVRQPQWLSTVKKVCKSKKFALNDRPWGEIGATHDVAILKTNVKIAFNNTVQPACLPTSELQMGALGNQVGFEWKRGRYSNMTQLPEQKCECLMEDERQDSSLFCIRPYHQYNAVCDGDSGGGFYVTIGGRQTVYGLASYGEDESCRPARYVLYLADIYGMRDEIKELIDECNN